MSTRSRLLPVRHSVAFQNPFIGLESLDRSARIHKELVLWRFFQFVPWNLFCMRGRNSWILTSRFTHQGENQNFAMLRWSFMPHETYMSCLTTASWILQLENAWQVCYRKRYAVMTGFMPSIFYGCFSRCFRRCEIRHQTCDPARGNIAKGIWN